LDPLANVKCLDVSAELNLTCPRLQVEVDVCCKAGISCYTSCGTQKTVCDLELQVCLLKVKALLDLCDQKGVKAFLDLLSADLTVCKKYQDAQKYGCECGGAGGATEGPSALPPAEGPSVESSAGAPSVEPPAGGPSEAPSIEPPTIGHPAEGGPTVGHPGGHPTAKPPTTG